MYVCILHIFDPYIPIFNISKITWFNLKLHSLQLLSRFFQKSGFVQNHNRVLIFVAVFDRKKLKLLFECRVFSQTKIWSGKWYHYLTKKEIPLRFSFFKKTFSFLFRKTRKKDRFRFYLDRQEKKWPELKTLSKN